MARFAAASTLMFSLAAPLVGQSSASRADSALVGRILLAEDRRDTASAAFAEAARSADPRIRLLGSRAIARIRDPKFAARTTLPMPVAPPVYPDPAWRLRLRELTKTSTNCGALRTALSDSAWPVRLRAADSVGRACSSDSVVLNTLRAWTARIPANARRQRGSAGWQASAHALMALTRAAPSEARAILPTFAASPVPWLRTYAAHGAAALSDTTALRRLSRDDNANVKEAAIAGLSHVAGHAGDDEFLAALAGSGYQAIRAAARALKGSTRAYDVLMASLAAAHRLQLDSSETSHDTRMAVFERIAEFAGSGNVPEITALARDFDCDVAQAAASLAARLGGPKGDPLRRCTRLPVTLPSDAVALALGRDIRLRVTLADSSGGGSFTVRLRGDVAPLMAARVLALARSGYYNGLTWHRVEPDFVIQGGGTGANEYVGHPRYMRDELGTVPHVRGTVGMSTRGHDTGDGQWFVNLRDNLRLNGDYTVFAEVVDGIDVVDGVLEGDVIQSIVILRS